MRKGERNEGDGEKRRERKTEREREKMRGDGERYSMAIKRERQIERGMRER